MKKIFPLLFGGALIAVLGACDAKTASNAPNSTENNGQAPATNTAQTNQNDASNDVRKKQIESDIRAREQRNDAGGDNAKRADGDLESEVRGKLEANIPSSKLTVDSKDGAVTVAGTVANQDQLNKVEPLAKQIKGVKSVAVKATVAPPKNK
jgi:osmotically-inducible protein OsmY